MEPIKAGVKLLHEEITGPTLGVFFTVYNELGGGFLEKVYRIAFEMVAKEAGLQIAREVYMPVWFRGSRIAEFYADFIVNGLVLVEIKAQSRIDGRDEAQMMNYLRASDIEVGLLLNFGRSAEFKRHVYENSGKQRNPVGDGPVCNTTSGIHGAVRKNSA